MFVALYLRRSTDEHSQPESLVTQEESLRAHAAREGYTVTVVYRDSGSGRSTRDRPAFRELIETVKRGASFQAILVRDVSRWGRFLNVDESAYWEFVCLIHDVRVVYVEEAFGAPSPTSTLMKALKRWGAAEASLERGRITSYGKARAVRSGFASGAPCPYAMRRILVDKDGSFLQFLERGQRKVLTTQHVKLAPGDPAHIAVVCAIFERYSEGWGRSTIAANLRASGIPSPRFRAWTTANVTDVLQNEAYIGTSVLHAGDGTVRAVNAWPAIVDRGIWDVTARRLDLEMATHARRKAALGISQKQRVDPLTRAQGPSHAETEAAAVAIALLRRELEPFLSSEDLTPFGSSVQCAISFPHATKHTLTWAFPIDRTYDATVGIGLTTLPEVRIVALYFFDHSRIRAGKLFPRIYSKTPHRRSVDVTALRRRLRLHLNWQKVATRICDALRDVALIDMPALARELGWPLKRTRTIVETLEHRGVALPPRKIKAGRRITVICDMCGATRELAPGQALRRFGRICRTCSDAGVSHGREIVTCPFCSVSREVKRSAFVKLSRANRTPCRRCQVSRRSSDFHRERRPLLLARAAQLNELADAIVACLRRQFSTYQRARKRTASGFANPSIYWTGEDGGRQRLLLAATEIAVRRGIDVKAEVVRAASPENWSRHEGARTANVTFRYVVT